MFKKIFNLIDTTIQTAAPEVRWIDFDLGQMEMEQPPVSWPCVLVGFDDTEFLDILSDVQQGRWMVDLKVGFRLRERTHSKAAVSFRTEALEHLDLLHKIHLAMQKATADCISSVSRVAISNEKRADYRVYTIRYAVIAVEGPSDDEKDYKNWKTYDNKPENVDPDFEVILEPEE